MKEHKILKLNLVLCLLLALILSIIALPCINANADDTTQSRVIKVGVTDTKGLSSKNADGTRSGIVIDYLNEIAKYTGWKYEFLDYDEENSTNTIQDTNDGKIDLSGGCYTGFEATYPKLLYPDYSCGYVQNVLFARNDDDSFMLHDLTSIDGKKIGVYKHSVYGNQAVERLDSFLSFYSITNAQLVEFDETDTAASSLIDRLNNKEVDLIMGNTFSNYEARVIATFNSREHYITTSNSEIQKELNSALKWIYEGNPQFSIEVYEKNTTENSQITISLDTEELAYIKEKGNITVAVKDDFEPLFSASSNRAITGITGDILNLISAYTGLAVEYVYADTYYDSIQLVKDGKADMLGFFLDNEEFATENNLALTSSYTTLSRVIIKNKKVAYPSYNLKAGILKGRELPEDILTMADNVTEYNTIAELTQAVDKGEIDFAYGYSSYFERIMQDNFYTNIQLVTIANNQSNISFAMAKPVNAQLFTIINKSIYNISTTTKDEILANNLISESISDYPLEIIIARHPGLFAAVVCGAALLLLIIIFVLAFYKVRQTRIKNELTMATAENIAKSDFLSRMSHEIKTPMNSIITLADLTSMQQGMPAPVKENIDKIRSSSQYLLCLINDILDMSRIENSKMTIGAEPFSLGRMLDEIHSMMDTEVDKKGIKLIFDVNIKHDVLVGDVIRLRQVLTNLLSNAIKFTEMGDTITVKAVENGLLQDSRVNISFHVIDTGSGINRDDQKRIFKVFEQAGNNYTQSQGVGLGLAISHSLVQLMGGELKVNSETGHGSDFTFSISLPQGELKRAELARHNNELNLNALNILIVEDNELNAEIAADLLKVKGANVTIAKNGREGVETFEKSKVKEFDVILMDIQMPIMNGLEATKAIRSSAKEDASTIPIIAMTANTFKEDVDLAFTSGMNAFLPKPLDINKLYTMIVKFTHGDLSN